MNLLQRDDRGHHNVFHLGSVLNSSVRISVKRLDKGSCIINAQQSSLDTDAPG